MPDIKVSITRSENADFFHCSIGDVVSVDIEHYVAAVVASEIGNTAIEACKAQAIAARTFAISRGVLKGKVISDSSATAQAYRANRYGDKYQNARKAAEKTEGLVLMHKSSPISAVYSAGNGGRTVSSKERWGSDICYLIEQDDPWDQLDGRPKWGHGVGMSQRGAIQAAKLGKTYEEILAFYYPTTTIVGGYGKMAEGTTMNQVSANVKELADSKMGDPYVYGAWGEQCTPETRKRRANNRPEYKDKIYNSCRVLTSDPNVKPKTCASCKWNGCLCYDCRGFTYYCLLRGAGIKLNGGGATSQYNDNSNWEQKGTIDQMPDLVCCVFKRKGDKMSHTGLHVGDGVIDHCSTIVKRGSISDTTWTHYAIPKGLYTKEEIASARRMIRLQLKRGSSGEEVKALQEKLNALGYDCGTADGKFGTKTDTALRLFQTANGLAVDGIAGNATISAIDALLNPADTKQEEENSQDENKNINEDLSEKVNGLSERVTALEGVVSAMEERINLLIRGGND